MTVAPATVLRRRSDVRFRHVGDESVVVKQGSGEVLVLNGVGGRVLELIDGKRSLSALVDELEREFDVDRDTLEREAMGFAAELEDAGLVEVAAGEAHHAP